MNPEESEDALRPVAMSESQWRQLAELSERELAVVLRLLSPAPLSWREAARTIPARLGDQVAPTESSQAWQPPERRDDAAGPGVRAGEHNGRGRV